MGVCCIVFDIDGMLFEFFMIFLNIEKNTIFRSSIPLFCIPNVGLVGGGGCVMFFSHFMLIPTFLKKTRQLGCPRSPANRFRN